jgi:hypothetical protein
MSESGTLNWSGLEAPAAAATALSIALCTLLFGRDGLVVFASGGCPLDTPQQHIITRGKHAVFIGLTHPVPNAAIKRSGNPAHLVMKSLSPIFPDTTDPLSETQPFSCEQLAGYFRLMPSKFVLGRQAAPTG